MGGEAGRISLGGLMGSCGTEGISVWIKGRDNTAVKLKQGRRGRGGGRAGDYVGERERGKTSFALSIPTRRGRVAAGSIMVAHQQRR